MLTAACWTRLEKLAQIIPLRNSSQTLKNDKVIVVKQIVKSIKTSIVHHLMKDVIFRKSGKGLHCNLRNNIESLRRDAILCS